MKDNPRKIGSSDEVYFTLIFPGVGLIFAILGGTGIAVKVNKKRREKELKENGDVIFGTYVETVKNVAYSVNGRNPYNIVCEWINPEDGKKYLFDSENLWINPQKIIQDRNINTFRIYIKPGNIKQYVIDVDEIKEEVVDLR